MIVPSPMLACALAVGVQGSVPGGAAATAHCSVVGMPHGMAFFLGGSAPDAGLHGGQGVRQAGGAYRAPEAHGFSGGDLC